MLELDEEFWRKMDFEEPVEDGTPSASTWLVKLHNQLLKMANGRQQSGLDAVIQDILLLKQDSANLHSAISQLEDEKDNLRQAVRKLKLENTRCKDKIKKMQTQIKSLGGAAADESDEDIPEYDDIGRDFILVGGVQDPLSIRFEAIIQDNEGHKHKSAERYYWYKMAEKFGDKETMQKILEAPNTPAAEEAMKETKGFDEKVWDEVKVAVWETGQRLKLDQVRWISNLLIETGNTYIAVSHQDKMLGTGWRKNREESNKPIFWDGKNLGGKFLMRYRKIASASHAWAGPNEKEETTRKYVELRRYVWRRIDQSNKRGPPFSAPRRGLRGGFRGGSRGGFSSQYRNGKPQSSNTSSH